MRHTDFALRRPVTVIMVFVALAAIGILSSQLLPLEKFPDIEFPGLFVQIPYRSTTPEEVEQQITRPIEEALATLSGVEQMQSTSIEDQAQIFVQFGWDEDASRMGIEARARIDAARDNIPSDVERILIFTGSLGDQPILVLRISSSRDLSDAYQMLDHTVKRRLERLEGVSRVELQGVDPREIRILLDVDRVAAHGVDIRDLRELLEKSNFAVSAGQITDAGQRFSVRPRGEFTSLEDIENIVVDNRNLRLSDIATVELRSPDRNYGRHLNRTYAVGINIYKQTGANMVEVNDRVQREIRQIGKLPQMQGINIFDLDNQADNVRESLNDLLSAGLVGAFLAIGVLFLFLRQWSTTLIVTLAVPFSLLITLAAMYFFGLSLNILTMMGLMLAVGMLVDNAVVVTESIFRYRIMHPDEPVKATLLGVNEVGLAVIAGTATSIIVFLPIMFGQKMDITVFLTHVAITIVVALLASLAIAQTIVPMLAARVPPPPVPKKGALMTRLTEKYVGSLAWVMKHRWWTALAIVLIMGSVALPMKFIKFDAFPQESGRRLFMPYHVDEIYPLDRIEAAVDKIEDFLYANQEKLDIVEVYSYFDTGRAESTILLTDKDEATISTKDVIEFITENVPELVIGKPSFQFDQQAGGEGFSIQISGDSTELLNELSFEVERILETIDGLTDVISDADTGAPEIQITVDRERAMAVGLNTELVAQFVSLALRGENLREFRGEDGEITVRMAFRDSDKQTVDDLAALPLYTASGERITLGAIADFKLARGPQAIRRVDRRTAVVINANMEKDKSLEDVKPYVEKVMDEFAMPPGYSWKFGRGFDRQDDTQKIMAENTLLGVAMIFIVMAALFESVLFPLAIIVSIVFAIIGVFWFFFVTGTTFSFMASIGIMILIGVVVNNGIVLVDHINNLRHEGMERDKAIIEAGRDRLRPILMTVATTILGLAPLAVGTTQVGGDGPPYYPMARAIIGGLAFSTVTSLLVVPYLYVVFDGMVRWGRKVMHVSRLSVRTS
ncbi:MAG: efflux RND transporter permease subunit [Gammaproteobacteria bacterium]|nr:efflux RND transporter permease subunit [Gammaproteobacteria bacterium]